MPFYANGRVFQTECGRGFYCWGMRSTEVSRRKHGESVSVKCLTGRARRWNERPSIALTVGMSCLAGFVSSCGTGSLSEDQSGPDWGAPVPTVPVDVSPSGPGVSPTAAVPTGVTPPPPGNVTPGVTPTVPTAPSVVPPPPADTSCDTPQPGRTPLRRLTRFEYSNTIEALLGDTSRPGQQLPAELLGNGFGNDADNQPTSPFLIEQYSTLAHDLAARVAQAEVAGRYDACILQSPPDEAGCARSFIASFAEAAYRRPVATDEVDGLVGLQQELRGTEGFVESITGVVEAILQSPDFLYRVEFGQGPDLVRPLTGHEMASRLSYFFWGAPPDAQLLAAANSGALADPEGVRAEAERLLNDARARRVVEFFFDSYLPINNLTDQTRDKAQFPTFSAQIGNLQHQETQHFLMHEIFEGTGTWNSVLTAPYTFVNEELAAFYGIDGVVGQDFVKVDLDTTKRLGLLTQGGILTGTTVTNATNPVRRGGFLLSHVLCVEVPLPAEDILDKIKPPEPYAGSTGRERYTAHSQDEQCAGCHALLDPPGFGLENFDAVGLWRDQENGVTIDASGNLLGSGAFSGPVELVQRIAENPGTYACFAQQWQKFGYGRSLDGGDKCNKQALTDAFEQSGHDVKELLLALTQTDGFRFLSTEEQL